MRLVEKEFVDFIRYFIRAFGAVFGILEHADLMPTEKSMRMIATKLFSRISEASGQKLKKLALESTLSKKFIAETIRERQTKPRSESIQTIKYTIIEKWSLNRRKDPFSMPYALALERFCVLADCRNRDERHLDWSLSHSRRVSIPEGSSVDTDEHIPSIGQLILWRDAYEYGRSESFMKANIFNWKSYLERKYCFHESFEVEERAWSKFMFALESAGNKGCKDLECFLKFAYPWFDEAYIGLFLQWLHTHDVRADKYAKAAKAAEVACADSIKTVIPDEVLASRHKEFKNSLEHHGLGYTTIDTLAEYWEIDIVSLGEQLNARGIHPDHILLEEFIVLALEDENYLLNGLDGEAVLLFGDLVKYKKQRLEGKFAHEKENLPDSRRHRRTRPRAFWPEVSEDQWNSWQKQFDHLDRHKQDGRIEIPELRHAGLHHDI